MKQRRLALPLPLAVVVTLVLFTAAASGEQRTIQRSMPSADIEVLELAAGNGDVAIDLSDDDQIHLEFHVTARPSGGEDGLQGIKRWFLKSRLEDDRELLAAIELEARTESGRLVVRPQPRGSSVRDRTEERWVVRIPSHLAVDLSANSAKVRVEGVAGGVRLRQVHGDAEVRVPGGDLDLELQVGNIEATSGVGDYRRVELDADVGRTRLYRGNRRMRYPRPPGPGSYVTLEGRGEVELNVQVQVGDAELRLVG